MLPVIGILLVAATAVPILITVAVQFGGFANMPHFSQVAGYATVFLLIFALALLLYAYLPNRKHNISFGVPGAIFTAVAWEPLESPSASTRRT